MEEKMAGQTPYEGKRLWLAQLISRLSNPLYVAPPLFLIVAVLTAPSLWVGLVWSAVIGIGISVVPILFIRRGVRQGTYSNVHVSRREQRFVPFVFTVLCMVIVLVLLFFLQAPIELLATVTAMIVTLLAALAITQWARWKISLHLIGLSGALTTMAVVIEPVLSLSFVLLAVIGWARWKVRAHTIGQICAGSLLGCLAPLSVYQLFGL
ncbi:hypothetical protein [Paenibacillus daejeonensis]|uniref:hypothetical protein n=1 Tax=Paenibacillus daejeonensis TaxID=135193 RepID=UPI00036E317E|nr:hypothetical protein [Paenibacillus daejeonensis]